MHRPEKNAQGTDFLSLEGFILETYGKFKIFKIFILDGKLQNKIWTGNQVEKDIGPGPITVYQ